MKVIVTGGSGLLGRPTIKEFEKAGCDGNKSHDLFLPQTEFYLVNILYFYSCWYSLFSRKKWFSKGIKPGFFIRIKDRKIKFLFHISLI